MSEGGFVNCVNCVTGGISGERGVPPAEGIALPLREYQPPVVALPPLPPADDPAEIETLALVLMAEAERNPPVTITDPGKAALYWRGEAMRRLALIRQRAIDATIGPDIERAAIMAEETAPMMPAKAHSETVTGLLRAASPLAGVLGARPCRSCGRGVWTSPTCPGPHPPDLCAECRWTSRS